VKLLYPYCIAALWTAWALWHMMGGPRGRRLILFGAAVVLAAVLGVGDLPQLGD
jgi:hypothetical protein